MRCANGRAATTLSCARFKREAAIIFIAFVICCVDLTARIRRRKSRSDGISFCSNYATARLERGR